MKKKKREETKLTIELLSNSYNDRNEYEILDNSTNLKWSLVETLCYRSTWKSLVAFRSFFREIQLRDYYSMKYDWISWLWSVVLWGSELEYHCLSYGTGNENPVARSKHPPCSPRKLDNTTYYFLSKPSRTRNYLSTISYWSSQGSGSQCYLLVIRKFLKSW